ncbi:DUF6207 family protein [Streptomyces cyaneofuscatus]|uniref:DUF6207 family protein n=1 Tax=Streptomyces cyaneofuscatus TaxID=66883 RepID=UPI0033174627
MWTRCRQLSSRPVQPTQASTGIAQPSLGQLGRGWATSGMTALRRDPGAPGVRGRMYADVRRAGAEEE